MSDYGHDQTDKALKDLEKRITKEYKQAAKEVEAKLEKYLQESQKKDAQMRAKRDAGDITDEEYTRWRINNYLTGQRWEEMSRTLAEDLTNADKIAASMINKTLPDAYALNYNYGTYEVEHGARINTSFSLYDHATVENLMKKDPKIIPKARIDIPKDELWNRKKLTSAVTQGILQGEAIPKIAKRLASVANMDKNAAIRNARTYTTAAENAGRIDSYERANDKGIHVKKKWMATLDDRTRMEHRHLDGQSVENDEEFQTDGYKISYPGDPSADPEMIYNCRCTLVADIPTIDYHDERNDSKLGEMSYEEWKTALDREEPEEVSPEEPQEEKQEEKQEETAWIDRIKEIQGQDSWTEEDVKEAGHLIAEQVHGDYLEELKKQKEEAEGQLKAAAEEWKKAKEEYWAAAKEEKFENSALIHIGINKVEDSKYFSTKEEAEAYYKKTNSELEELAKIREEKYNTYLELCKISKGLGVSYDETANNLKEILSQVREMGSDGLDVAGHFGNSRSAVRKNLEWAYDKYPRSWVEQSIDFGDLKVKKVSRGYYSDWRQEIAISGDGDAGSNRTSIHELGHRFEHCIGLNKELLMKETEFYDRRTAGEKLVWLGPGYGRDEKTRKDDFVESYMGKDYNGRAYELISYGCELAYCDPVKLAEDPDMEEWIYGLLAVIP